MLPWRRTSTPSFTVSLNGLAGLAFDASRGGSRGESYSLVGVVRLVAAQAAAAPTAGGTLGLYFLDGVFVVCALGTPVLQSAVLVALWCGRLGARARQRLRAVDEVLASWQYLEVYLIAIILAILQLPQISRFIIMDADGASLCAPLAAAFDLLVAIGAVDESDAECLYIGATLEVGVYLLLAAALALNLAGQVTRRLARAVGGDGAAAAKPSPEGAEAEAAARGGASAGALVVSTQI